MASTRRSAATPRLAWEFLAQSEIGLVRKNNQDSGYVSATMLLVADGMGGAAAGDLASAVAVDTIAQVDDQSGSSAGDPSTRSRSAGRLEALAGGISAANTRLAELIKTDHTLEGMGTTVTAAVLEDDGIGLAHLGDSRAYLINDEGMQQLTHDHSWVQSLIDEGKISEEEAAAHPHRSLLLKVLNGQPANEPDLRSIPARPGDRLLLCSDGLCGFVEDAEIRAALTGSTLTEAMNRLVAAAHAAGGLDNITIIIADLYDPETTAIRPSLAGEGEHPTEATAELDLEISESRVAGPTGEPHRLGAAAAQDVSAAESMIKERAALRAAAQAGDYDELDSDEDGEYDEDLDDETEDEDRYAPQPPSKRRWQRPLLLSLVVLLIIAAGTAAGYAWTRTQYYVGAADENVAIFQGLNDSVPGLPLSRVYEVQDLRVSELPGYYQQLVRSTIDTGTLDSARATVRQLRETADRCAAQREAQSPPPSKETSKAPPKGSPKSSPSSSPGKAPTTKPKPSKSSSPTKSTSAAPPSSASPTPPGDAPGDEKC